MRGEFEKSLPLRMRFIRLAFRVACQIGHDCKSLNSNNNFHYINKQLTGLNTHLHYVAKICNIYTKCRKYASPFIKLGLNYGS